MTPEPKKRIFDETQLEHCRYCDLGDDRPKCLIDHESNKDLVEQEMRRFAREKIVEFADRLKAPIPGTNVSWFGTKGNEKIDALIAELKV